jgi:tetratricopeptide (TPR) repeat protein
MYGDELLKRQSYNYHTIKPLSLAAYIGLLRVYSDAGKYQKIIAMTPRLEAQFPSVSAVHQYISLTYFKTGDIDRAISYTEKALMIDPQDEISLVNLGVMHEQKGNTALAIAQYKKAIGQTHNQNAYRNLAHLYRTRGERDLLNDLLADAVKAYPNNAEFHRNMRQ